MAGPREVSLMRSAARKITGAVRTRPTKANANSTLGFQEMNQEGRHAFAALNNCQGIARSAGRRKHGKPVERWLGLKSKDERLNEPARMLMNPISRWGRKACGP